MALLDPLAFVWVTVFFCLAPGLAVPLAHTFALHPQPRLRICCNGYIPFLQINLRQVSTNMIASLCYSNLRPQ